MKPTPRIQLTVFLLIFTVFFAFPASGQENASRETQPRMLKTSDAESELAKIVGDESIDEELKTTLKDLYQQTFHHLKATEAANEKARQFNSLASDVAGRLEKAKNEFDEEPPTTIEVDESASLESIRADLANAKSKLAALAAAANELSAEPARRQKRLAEIPSEIAVLEKEQEEIREQLVQSPPLSESEIQTRSRSTLLQARAQATAARLDELQKEQSAYIATTDFLPKRIELANRRVEEMNRTVEQLQTVLAQRQMGKVEESIAGLKEDLESAPENLKELAQSNIELAQRQQKLIADTAEATKRLDDIQKIFETLKSSAATSRDRIGTVGLTEALGITLRNRKLEYEQIRSEYAPLPGMRNRIEQFQLETFQLEDELTKIDSRIAGEDTSPEVDGGTDLLRKRKELLEGLQRAQNNYLQLMLTTDTRSYELRRAIDAYINFIDEHVFWIQSSPAFSPGEWRHLPAAARWLSSPNQWNTVFNRLGAGVRASPVGAVVWLLSIGILFAFRPRLRRIIAAMSEHASRSLATFRPTTKTLFATLVYAAAWPTIFFAAGSLLKLGAGEDAFVTSVGSACSFVAIFLAPRCVFLGVCREKGLATSHLGWDLPVRATLRKHLIWFAIVGSSLLFPMVILYSHTDEPTRVASLRFASILLFVASAMFHHFVFRSSSPVYAQVHQKNPDSRIYRWRKVIWAILFGLPVLFAILAMLGYLDTAFRLSTLFQSTYLLGGAVVLGIGLMLRWLTLNRRKVRRQQEREARAIAEKSKDGSLSEDVGVEIEDGHSSDLPVLDQQTRKLIYMLATVATLFGLFYIWSDLLPVIEIFDKVTFWSVTIGENVESVSLRDLLYIVVIIFVSSLAIRNLPGLVELLALRSTSLDSGARYALTTILRYVLVVFAIVLVLSLLSVPWTQMGWLLTAASVGLGFGLQEIVANFVSGIILLLERPIRVGDVVTIDGTTGVVSRIQMRATTVTNWDRKELIVPNKDLITEKLLNWSLSNVVNRLTLEVGVDYNSDPDQVRDILGEILTDHPDVMSDPGPRINFESFGDSALNFTIRFYLENLDNRIGVTHEINTSIIKALRAADISIPFPQRDLHVKVESKDDLLSN